jgi:hypothetical protein
MDAKGAGVMLVFAVDVVADRAPKRDKSGPGRRRQKPTVRNDELKDRGEADAGFGAKAARLGVEPDRSVRPAAWI